MSRFLDPVTCPKCRKRRGCNETQFGPHNQRILVLRCSDCGHRYIHVSRQAQNVLDAYDAALRYVESGNPES